jgi:hypothetical protein
MRSPRSHRPTSGRKRSARLERAQPSPTRLTHDNGKHSELCLADGIAWIDLSDVGFQSPEIAAAAAVAGVNHFPLRVVVTDASGAVESRMEATKVEKKKLDDASFAVPPDYQVTDMARCPPARRTPDPRGAEPRKHDRPGRANHAWRTSKGTVNTSMNRRGSQ